jgi:hypothetical protein
MNPLTELTKKMIVWYRKFFIWKYIKIIFYLIFFNFDICISKLLKSTEKNINLIIFKNKFKNTIPNNI